MQPILKKKNKILQKKGRVIESKVRRRPKIKHLGSILALNKIKYQMFLRNKSNNLPLLKNKKKLIKNKR
jgi:hypothetical protein